MNRLNSFHAMRDHAWFKRVYTKLADEEILMAEFFILQNDHLSKYDFESAVNRMFIDKERPRNWTMILDLLSNANV